VLWRLPVGGICALVQVEIGLEGSLIVGNTAESKGGGIFVQESSLRVVDTTVAYNTAGASGGKQPRSYPECRLWRGFAVESLAD
jgi:predicted outer membrane repeat protein